jgi:tRNA threonylcarbamoyladenosine biosynthesis protein TsaB
VLGIRTAAMALRTWAMLRPRPVFAYQSLALVAHALGEKDAAVIADARRETWHRYAIGGALQRVAAAELAGRLLMPEGLRHWSALPPAVASTPYAVGELLERTRGIDLLRATEAPDAFLHEEPSYATWTPQIHRAPEA